MSLSPEVIDALVASGATIQQLAAAVKADIAADERRRADQAAGERERLAAEEEAIKERRARAAAKKRRQRSGANGDDVTPCPPPSPGVPGDMPGQVGTSQGRRGTSPETKASPTPPSKTQTPEFTPPIVPPSEGEGGDDETDGLFDEPASPKARRKQAKALRLAADVEFAQLWNIATPLMRRRGKSQEVVHAAWEAAKGRQVPALIVGALRRYVTEDEDVKRGMGQPGLQRWLADKAYDQWLAESDGVPGITDDRWRMMVEFFRDGTPWSPDLGPPPGEPGCRAPPAILAEFDLLSSHRSAA